MLQARFQVPLSPPNSPRMSDAAPKSHDYSKFQQLPAPFYDPLGAVRDFGRPYNHCLTESTSRPYDPAPYGGSAPGHASYHYSQQHPSHREDLTKAEHAVQAKTDGHNATTPRDRLTPRSPTSVSRDQHDDEDEIEDSGAEDLDGDEDPDKPPMTAAEIRAQKRKMKRFRLSHSQTRFLMNEFTRQAHPDAAHRARLAREIPGLSARQVQVWFQNRRAKLKRLTNDDRERMLRSRALPADFDTTQALHSPFGAQGPSAGASASSIGAYGYSDSSGVRPLTLDTLRRVPDYEQYGQQYAAPSGVSPALSAFGFTPPPSASEHLSPASLAGSASPYVLPHSTSYDASRRLPTGLPALSHTSYPVQQPQLQRLPFQDRFGRSLGEPTSSPLRSTVSYAHLTSANAQPRHIPERAASFSDHSYARTPSQTTSAPSSGALGPQGLGFSYSHSSPFQPAEHQYQSTLPTPYTSAEPERTSRPTPISYAQYPSSSFTTPSSQYPTYSGQYSPENYHNSYAQQGQVTEPVSQPQQQQQPHGYSAAPSAAQAYMHGH